MPLRKHQQELKEIARQIAAGEKNVTRILAWITQGGGKSAYAMILASQFPESWKICWVAPRDALREQGDYDFRDPRNIALYGHTGKLRRSQNSDAQSGLDPDLTRGERGYITTYQAVNADREVHQQEFDRHPYILILDESHHLAENADPNEDDAPFSEAVKPLVERAKLVVFMTGSLERHDNARIAFIPYEDMGIYEPVDFTEREGWAFIRYTRPDALADGATLPLEVIYIDGSASWADRRGVTHSFDKFKDAGADNQSSLLYTITRTGYADHLLDIVVEQWRGYKQNIYKPAKLLVVSSNIALAKKYLKYLREQHGLYALIATCDDTNNARVNIRKFRGLEEPEADVLVTVAMAYEGLDVREITHVALLTWIRSFPWIEQAISRANRVEQTGTKTRGYIYGPDDAGLNKIITELGFSPWNRTAPWAAGSDSLGEGEPDGTIQPITSDTTGRRSVIIYPDNHVVEVSALEMKAIDTLHRNLGIKGISAEQTLALIQQTGGVIEIGEEKPAAGKSVTEDEATKRKAIKNMIEEISGHDRHRLLFINSKLKELFGERRLLSSDKLDGVLKWLNEKYRR